MDTKLIVRLIIDKLHDRTTYVLALIVGTLINVFGQLLVPWFRNVDDPVAGFLMELETRPGLAVFSVFLGYGFPFCVGIYSAVAVRYKNRRIESIADFPERKPDPVFRARKDGEFVEVGSVTQQFFDQYNVRCAQSILGEKAWDEIVSRHLSGGGTRIFFEAANLEFVVTYVPTGNDQINVYMTRLPAASDAAD